MLEGGLEKSAEQVRSENAGSGGLAKATGYSGRHGAGAELEVMVRSLWLLMFSRSWNLNPH